MPTSIRLADKSPSSRDAFFLLVFQHRDSPLRPPGHHVPFRQSSDAHLHLRGNITAGRPSSSRWPCNPPTQNPTGLRCSDLPS
ncbi:hypothetical protein C8035_v004702 [Colletotrichum spinosum]|uniref:Uncharacterized protein n=1 Tax=Colletotrichum spinosum TaxID=1347390 RepID=A0A4R8QI08_9PEZI|nr:hypothetical protein C8035_v004702 [Colletotrichum spinosum]